MNLVWVVCGTSFVAVCLICAMAIVCMVDNLFNFRGFVIHGGVRIPRRYTDEPRWPRLHALAGWVKGPLARLNII